MRQFIVRRILYSFVTLFILSLTIFAVVRLTRDPALLMAEPGARPTLLAGQWWLTVFPGACIMLIVLATQLFGDWLRVRLDPQLRNL
jgi:peptide/nickel transport system permease protein